MKIEKIEGIGGIEGIEGIGMELPVHHVGFLTKDLDRSLAQFLALGFSLERAPMPDEVRGVQIAFVKNGGYRVELICPKGKDSPMYPLLARYKNTPYHFCYRVEALDAAIEALAARGYTLFDPPKPAPCIEGCRVAFLLHRDVGIIELAELAQDPWS